MTVASGVSARNPRHAATSSGPGAEVSNGRGRVRLHAELFDGLQRGVVVCESIWPNAAFEDGIGINALTGADPGAPTGGAAFHDNRVSITAL